MMKFLVMFCLFIALFNEMEAKPVERTLGTTGTNETQHTQGTKEISYRKMGLPILLFYRLSLSYNFLFFLDDPNICCYSNSYGEYFWTCTDGCNGVVKPLSQCQGRDTCNECGGITCSSMPGKLHHL